MEIQPYEICRWAVLSKRYTKEEIIRDHQNLLECYLCIGQKRECIEDNRFLSYERDIREMTEFYLDEKSD